MLYKSRGDIARKRFLWSKFRTFFGVVVEASPRYGGLAAIFQGQHWPSFLTVCTLGHLNRACALEVEPLM